MEPAPTPVPAAGVVQRARFDDLDARTLYDLLRLRSEVFVVEQDCVFCDLDGRDHEPDAEHLWVRDHDGIAAELRLLRQPTPEQPDQWSIGRVVARSDVRGSRCASQLVEAGLRRLGELGCTSVVIGAQAHLEGWYGRFGFVACGPGYDEDGIPHLPMRRDLEPAPST